LINFASKVEVENILCFIEDDGSYEFIKLFEEKISDFSTSNIVSNDYVVIELNGSYDFSDDEGDDYVNSDGWNSGELHVAIELRRGEVPSVFWNFLPHRLGF